MHALSCFICNVQNALCVRETDRDRDREIEERERRERERGERE